MNADPSGADPLPYAVLLRRVKDLRSQLRARRKSAPDTAAAQRWLDWERHVAEELRSHPLNDDLVRLAVRLENALAERPDRRQD